MNRNDNRLPKKTMQIVFFLYQNKLYKKMKKHKKIIDKEFFFCYYSSALKKCRILKRQKVHMSEPVGTTYG